MYFPFTLILFCLDVLFLPNSNAIIVKGTGHRNSSLPAHLQPVRQPIHSSDYTSSPQFNLLVLAVRDIMDFKVLSDTNWTSYYQIAGIHGKPFIQHDGAGDATTPKGTWPGYCPHSSTLFIPWHRMFVNRIEEVLWDHVQIIAASFPIDRRQKYINAAIDWRFPYLDWAAVSTMPSVLTDENIVVDLPEKGPNTTISNPLAHYIFSDTKQNFNEWPRTLRYTDTGPESDTIGMNAALTSLFSQLRAWIVDIFAQEANADSWLSITTKTYEGGLVKPQMSLEAIHDQIHSSIIGGNMDRLEFSAFDFIFFLHHCNVDRLAAIYQVANPTVWVQASDLDFGGTWTIGDGELVNSKTGLSPFFKEPGVYWNSDEIRDTAILGYTYPEIKAAGDPKARNIRSRIQKQIQTLYGGAIETSTATDNTIKRKRSIELSKLTTNYDLQTKTSPLSGSAPDYTVKDKLSVSNNHTCASTNATWVVNVRCKANSVKDTFAIYFFNTQDVPKDTKSWDNHPKLIAPYAFLTSSMMHSNLTHSGTVHLERVLIENGVCPDDVQGCASYLNDNLVWAAKSRITHTRIDLEDIEGLRIEVVAGYQVLLTATDLVAEDDVKYESIDYGSKVTVKTKLMTNVEDRGGLQTVTQKEPENNENEGPEKTHSKSSSDTRWKGSLGKMVHDNTRNNFDHGKPTGAGKSGLYGFIPLTSITAGKKGGVKRSQ